MNLTIAQLNMALPAARPTAGRYLAWLNLTMAEFGIDTPARQAAFLATIGAESGQLSAVVENLNYRREALVRVFPKYFPNLALADLYAHQPEKIANRVYANRGGNGDEASGDGWRYRGAGLIQLTFHDNQAACADHFDIPLLKIGDWLQTPEGACRSAGWFWQSNGINAYADRGDFDGVSDMVNRGRKTIVIGDTNGWTDRLALLSSSQRAMA